MCASVCLGVDANGTTIVPRLRTATRAGAASSNSARSLALGINSASDGAGRETLVLTAEVDDAVGVGVVGAEIETVVATTRPPSALLVMVSPVFISIAVVVMFILFSGLFLRLALRVSRTSGVCGGAVTVCPPFCGDTLRCAPLSAGTDARALLGKFILLAISASLDVVCSPCMFSMFC